MSKKGAIPDAWDDDWESQADKADAAAAAAKADEEVKISRPSAWQSTLKQTESCGNLRN